jgi:tRNA (guanine37-N1)-methyltransferase
MVMKPEPLAAAIRNLREKIPGAKVYALSPSGENLSDALARRLSEEPGVILVCGRYEGIDQRIIDEFCDGEISAGDYILTGGEPAAMCVLDAAIRQIPGVVGKADNIENESFRAGLKHPVYTRPADFEGRAVPGVLVSGNEAAVDRWRADAALARTLRARPAHALLAAKHRLVLEIENCPLGVAFAAARVFIAEFAAHALLLSPDAADREKFRGLIEGSTHTARTRREADQKIEKLVGPFAWLAFDGNHASLRDAILAALKDGKSAVIHIRGDERDPASGRAVERLLAAARAFDRP